MQEPLNRSIWRLDCGLRGPKEAQVQSYLPGGTNEPLNRPSAAAMRPVVKLL